MEYTFRDCLMTDFDFLFELKKQNFKKYVDKYWSWNDQDQKNRLKIDLEEHLEHKHIILLNNNAIVEFKVYRNAIARRAAEKLGHEDFAKTLVGPNALAFGKDPVAPARVLAKFAKKHEALVLKTGIVDGAMVDEATIQKLSALPNKEGMLAKFASCLNAPVIKFAMTVKALAEAKENGSVKTEEAPATEEAAA